MPSRAEIKPWLTAPTTFEQAVATIERARLERAVRGAAPKTPWWVWPLVPFLWTWVAAFWLAIGPRRAGAPQTFEDWYKAHLKEGDELWRYESVIPGQRDERGYAILHGGRIRDYWIETSVDIDVWPEADGQEPHDVSTSISHKS